ncbi:MAG: sigma-70 family RNA polymerase sigma factor [Planctomycetes bacterium]|nr:sigma-70 family RNA polymerase sigma factor [Planctomycetota bacterium]
MSPSPATRWSLIRKVRSGRAPDREDFARIYEPVVRAFLGARWRASPLRQDIDDAVQEVFLACFREGGALARVEPDHPGGFRAYLHGVVRHVAQHMERSRRRRKDAPGPVDFEPEVHDAGEERLSRVFDRAWALSLLREAVERQWELAREKDDDAVRRVELLRLRFEEGLPIREIAKRWEVDAARLHQEYGRARREYREALAEVVGWHLPGAKHEIAAECRRLLEYVD